MANTANNNPIVTARLSDNSVQNFYSTVDGSNRPTGFIRAYDYCPVAITADILAECGVAFYRPSQELTQAQQDFLEKFYDVILTDEPAEGKRLPMWVMVHKTHGVVGYFKPNLSITADSHTFKHELEASATTYVKKHFLPSKKTTFLEGNRFDRYSEE